MNKLTQDASWRMPLWPLVEYLDSCSLLNTECEIPDCLVLHCCTIWQSSHVNILVTNNTNTSSLRAVKSTDCYVLPIRYVRVYNN